MPFGPSAQEYISWIYYGGGKELFEEIYAKHNIKGIFCGVIPPEASGWFRKEINTLEDMKGMKMRFFGLGAKVMERIGVSTQLIAGGDIVGIQNYYFFDQQDFYYTLDVEETLQKWDTVWVVNRLEEILSEQSYDFLFLLLPFAEFHGHHKASTVLALKALEQLPLNIRPIALHAFVLRGEEDAGVEFVELPGHPNTKVM